jgi:arylsulfatase
VLNVDVAPAILSAAGIPAPARMQGKDFAPLYLSANPPKWRNEFFYEHPVVTNRERIPSSEAVVRKDVKYIYWPDWGYEELYDLKKDPLEEHNLVGDRSEASRLAEMRGKLEEMRRQAN